MISTLNNEKTMLEVELPLHAKPREVIAALRTAFKESGYILEEEHITFQPGFGSFMNVAIPTPEIAEAIQSALEGIPKPEADPPADTIVSHLKSL